MKYNFFYFQSVQPQQVLTRGTCSPQHRRGVKMGCVWGPPPGWGVVNTTVLPWGRSDPLIFYTRRDPVIVFQAPWR